MEKAGKIRHEKERNAERLRARRPVLGRRGHRHARRNIGKFARIGKRPGAFTQEAQAQMFNEMDDFRIEGPGAFIGKVILIAMLGAFAVASMITTFSFFAEYAPRIGTMIHAGFAAEIAGVMGVILFDAAGLGWTALRAYNADTVRQFAIATMGAIVTIALALGVSALYVIFSTDLVVGIYDDAGTLTAFGRNLQIAGVIVMAAGFVLNFALIAGYVNTGAGVARAVQQTEIAAVARERRFAAERRRASLVSEQMLEEIRDRLPEVAALVGREEGDRFLRESLPAKPTAAAGSGGDGARKNGAGDDRPT